MADDKWVWNIDGERYKIRIRKLSPRECWNLMTLEDSFDKAEEVNSNTQLYKQAGNSICRDLLCYILKPLFEVSRDE